MNDTKSIGYSIRAIVQRAFLGLSGLIAAGIALAIWLAPAAFYGSYGIDLAGDVNLINELKAPAGVLLVAGVVILAGAVRARFAPTSIRVAAILYLSFGASRFASFLVDGMPSAGLVSAAVLEIAIGAIAMLSLASRRNRPANP